MVSPGSSRGSACHSQICNLVRSSHGPGLIVHGCRVLQHDAVGCLVLTGITTRAELFQSLRGPGTRTHDLYITNLLQLWWSVSACVRACGPPIQQACLLAAPVDNEVCDRYRPLAVLAGMHGRHRPGRQVRNTTSLRKSARKKATGRSANDRRHQRISDVRVGSPRTCAAPCGARHVLPGRAMARVPRPGTFVARMDDSRLRAQHGQHGKINKAEHVRRGGRAQRSRLRCQRRGRSK